jgi:glycine dehydrogenase subunit 1
MRYLPHTPDDITAMLAAIGVNSLEALFPTIPEDCRRSADLNLLPPYTEWELNAHMQNLSEQNAIAPEYTVFLGAGSYDHYIPASVQYLLGRSEFSTSYTPYQPEVSQGTLQAIFEYQTLVCRLLDMEAANASMYDGASALAEALLMAIRATKRTKVAISTLIHPLYRQVVHTYFAPTDYELVELPYLKSGRTDVKPLGNLDEFAALAVQSPNFFGCVEDLQQIAAVVKQDTKTLFVTAFTEPLAYGLYKAPGAYGADIACGEGQSFGIPRAFGGPGLGMFATSMKYVRSMPGRLVGQTTDKEGRRGYVLTLATREQHIRRERATSNICTNQGLCATTAAMYMASLGGTGIRELARLNYDKAEYLKQALRDAHVELPFEHATFNEFVVKFPSADIYAKLLEKKIVAGLPLEPFYPKLKQHYVLCVTETCSKDAIDALVKEVAA